MRSDTVTKGMQQAPHRSLFNALGYTEEERQRPLVGIVCSYNEIVPGHMNLVNAKYELDDRPIEEGCQCPACRSYSRAYIRHLLKAKEMLGMRLCVLHNLYIYNTMMEEIREAIEQGRYKEYKAEKLAKIAGKS